MTIKDQALKVLRESPWLSSTEVAKRIGSSYGTVSSIFARLCKTGVLIRRENYGPHGGYGYAFPDQKSYFREGKYVFSGSDRPTLWEHLLGDGDS